MTLRLVADPAPEPAVLQLPNDVTDAQMRACVRAISAELPGRQVYVIAVGVRT